MADAELAKLLETQISLTEWIRRIDPAEGKRLAEEDNHKRERVGILNSIIGLPYDKPTKFEATDVRDTTPAFQNFLAEHGHELCAIRLNPKPGQGDLPKLRMRGKTIAEATTWFAEQDIDPEQYTADFVPHPADYSWATIFIVNKHGIFGEIYFGGHHILTQGFHTDTPPIVFSFNFKNWKLNPANAKAERYLQEMVAMILVEDPQKQQALKDAVAATFSHNYLNGYFETTDSKQTGTWFIDYNRVLGERYADFVVSESKAENSTVSGHMACGGVAEGTARVVSNPSAADFHTGDILVCTMTSPDYLPLMRKAAAIITDEGGILCHAAIVARELGIPCLVGTGNATQKFHGKKIRLDATRRTVTVLS